MTTQTLSNSEVVHTATFSIEGCPASVRIEEQVRSFDDTNKLTIDLELISHAPTVSFTGTFMGAIGQIRHELINVEDDFPVLQQLTTLWQRWHLNAMHVGTREQEQCLRHAPRDRTSTFEEKKRYLVAHNLEPDRGYSYGSAWLVEPVPKHVLNEIRSIISQLDGAVLGESSLDWNDCIVPHDQLFDTNDVAQSYARAQEEVFSNPDDEQAKAYLDSIRSFYNDIVDEIGMEDLADSYQLIHEQSFQEHARQLADDIGLVDREQDWPHNCINWKEAAEQLKDDYNEVDWEGVTFYFRRD